MFRIGVPLRGEVVAPIGEATRFGVISVEKGEIKGVDYFKNLREILEKIDFLVVTSDQEEVSEPLELGIEVLVTPFPEVGIAEVVEGFLFKELYRYRG
jgi:predicted Fe-Mo cluster-binding NifX family protein